MGKKSTKENKNIYFLAREEIGLTRDEASNLSNISSDKIEKIENDKLINGPDPHSIYHLSKAYNKPEICHFYCKEECEIGHHYAPGLEVDNSLSQMVLEMMVNLNALNKCKDRLAEITLDGVITDDELEDYVSIKRKIEKMAITINTLTLWTSKIENNGEINLKKLKEIEKRKGL